MISPEEQKILKSFAERIPVNDPGAHNNLAVVYYNKGLYDEAIEELEKALHIDPNFVLAKNNLEIVLKKSGRLEEKVEQLSRIVEKEPDDEDNLLELADTYHKLNRYSQAINLYKKVLDINSSSFEAHYGFGSTLKSLGKYNDALEEIKKALEIKISPEGYLTLGEVYFNKGIVDLAIKNFQESLLLEPSSAEGHFLLGFALGEKGKIRESVEEIRKAIDLNPALAQFEPNLPIDIKNHKGHLELLKEQLGTPKISQDEYQVHYNLAMTYRSKGLFNEANRELEECLKLKGDSPDVYLALGEMSIFLNKPDDAINYLKHAYEKGLDSAQCVNATGVAHIMRGEFGKAINYFQKAITLEKDFPQALSNLAVALLNREKITEAMEDFQKAINRGSADAKFNLGMYYLSKGDYEHALKLFDGEMADDYFGRGLVYMEIGRDGEALAAFKKAIEISPMHAGAHYNMGFILTRDGNFEEGLTSIRKAMEIEPNYNKEKYRFSLVPSLSEFGPYYTPTRGKDELVEDIEELFPKLEILDAKELIVDAENYFGKSEFERALSLVEEALELEPGWSKAILLKSKILYHQGNIDDAFTFLGAYQKEHPDNTEILATMGHMLKENGKLSEAKDVYTKLLKLEEGNAEWLTELAEIFYSKGELIEALSLFNKMYEMNNKDMAANAGLLKIYLRKKDLDKASTYLDFLQKNRANSYEFNHLAGIYWLERNDHKKATQYFKKSIELDSSKPHPYYELGLLQIHKGKFQEACDNWKKALLLSPDKELGDKIRYCLRVTMELNEFLKKEV